MPTAHNKGFMALIAVILLAGGVLAFSLAVLSAASAYADSVAQRELRIQARLNTKSCLDSAMLMVVKDFFLNGTTILPVFGCRISVLNPFAGGTITMNVVSNLNGVRAYGSGVLNINGNTISVVSEIVQ